MSPFKNPELMTDAELIDEYIEVNDVLDNVGFVDGAELEAELYAEIKRRGITDKQIEIREKELKDK